VRKKGEFFGLPKLVGSLYLGLPSGGSPGPQTLGNTNLLVNRAAAQIVMCLGTAGIHMIALPD